MNLSVGRKVTEFRAVLLPCNETIYSFIDLLLSNNCCQPGQEVPSLWHFILKHASNTENTVETGNWKTHVTPGHRLKVTRNKVTLALKEQPDIYSIKIEK